MNPPIICIVGQSGSGKTTLIEGLLTGLNKRGYRVGTIKHHSHDDFEIDHEGKDTWRHARAGAETVSISSPTMFAIIKKVNKELTLDEIAGFMEDRDVILADGYTSSEKPRIVINTEPVDFAHFGRGKEIVATIDSPFNEEQLLRIIDLVVARINIAGP
ncbi:MAG TPA: molybdopterin-guanine dinucleotide biosynthesis protein B [Candidatus Nanoarchaeia archaeon]|nr:molybdopterin-guanine dinucleotide biosynthesis protein B [Candidatus Nanoarchaeia archaeon]